MPGYERPPPLSVVTEAARIAALHSYRPDDPTPHEPFGTLVRMAAHTAQTPIAMITLVGRDRQWIKAAVGTDITEMPRALSLCNDTIAEPSGAMVVPDTRADARFQAHPLVILAPHVHFYAGVSLTDADGYVLGTLCVMDTGPSSVTQAGLLTLRKIAHEALGALALGRAEQDPWHEPARLLNAQLPNAQPSNQRATAGAAPGWLGVRTEHSLVPGSSREGRLVVRVADGSPAERAALYAGDIILAIDGRAARRRNDITAALARRAPGDVMRLQVWRNGEIFDCNVTTGITPEHRPAQRRRW